MRMWQWMMSGLMIMVMGAVSAPLLAQEGEPAKKEEPKADDKPKEGVKEGEKKEEEKEPDPESMTGKLRGLLKGIDDVIGKVEATEDDVKLYIKHHKALDATLESDAKFQELKEKNIKEAFDHLIKSEAYIAWCKQEKLEAEPFARKIVRVRMIGFKTYLPPALEEMLKMQKDMVETYKDSMTEEKYKEAIKGFADFEADLKTSRKEMEKISGPTDAEKKALEAHKADLLKLLEISGEEEEDDDGMDG